MTKAPMTLRDLRRKIYVKAKAEPSWRFWGLYVHVCKLETLRAAYTLAKANDGAPGIDRVTFEAIEASEWTTSSRSSGTNWSPSGIVHCGIDGLPFRRTGARKYACSRFRPFRPRGPGSAQAHSGTHLRGGLPTGFVWLSPKADGACGCEPRLRSHRSIQDSRH